MAGGGGIYRGNVDENIWPKGNNPMPVMRDQCLKPDNSKIKITFQNSYQCDQDKPCTFVVYFERGVVTEIKVQ